MLNSMQQKALHAKMALAEEAREKTKPAIISAPLLRRHTDKHNFRAVRSLIDDLLGGKFLKIATVEGKIREDLTYQWDTDALTQALKAGLGKSYKNKDLIKLFNALGLEVSSNLEETPKLKNAINTLFSIFDSGAPDSNISQNPSKAAIILAIAAASPELSENSKENTELNARYLVQLGQYFEAYGDIDAAVKCYQKAYVTVKPLLFDKEEFLSPKTKEIQDERLFKAIYDIQKLLAVSCDAVTQSNPELVDEYLGFIQGNMALNMTFEMREFTVKLIKKRRDSFSGEAASTERYREEASNLEETVMYSVAAILEELRQALENKRNIQSDTTRMKVRLFSEASDILGTRNDEASANLAGLLLNIKNTLPLQVISIEDFEKQLLDVAIEAQNADQPTLAKILLNGLASSKNRETQLRALHERTQAYQPGQANPDPIIFDLFELVQQQEEPDYRLAAAKMLAEAYPCNDSQNPDEADRVQTAWQHYYEVLSNIDHDPKDLQTAYIAVCDIYSRKNFGDGPALSTIPSQKMKMAALWEAVPKEEPLSLDILLIQFRTAFANKEYSKAEDLMKEMLGESPEENLPTPVLIEQAQWAVYQEDYQTAESVLSLSRDRNDDIDIEKAAASLFSKIYKSDTLETTVDSKPEQTQPLDELERKYELGICSEQDFHEFLKKHDSSLTEDDRVKFSTMHKEYIQSTAGALIELSRATIRDIELTDVMFGRSVRDKFPDSSVLPAIDLFNKLCQFVASDIIQHNTVEQRARCIEKWANVAAVSLHQYGDYNTTMAIKAALENSAIYRLSSSFESCTEQTREFLQSLNVLFETNGSFKNYRAALKSEHGAYIPYLGGMLTDQTFLLEGNGAHFKNCDLSSDEALVRMEQLSAGLGNSLLLQSVQKAIAAQAPLTGTNSFLQNAFEDFSAGDDFDNEAYKTSLLLEPRDEKPPVTTELADAVVSLAFDPASIERDLQGSNVNAMIQDTLLAKADVYFKNRLTELQELMKTIPFVEGSDLEIRLTELTIHSKEITAITYNLNDTSDSQVKLKLQALQNSLDRFQFSMQLAEKLNSDSSDLNLIISEMVKLNDYQSQHTITAFIDEYVSSSLDEVLVETRRKVRAEAMAVFDIVIDNSYEERLAIESANLHRNMNAIAEIVNEKPWSFFGFGPSFTDNQKALLFGGKLKMSLANAKEKLLESTRVLEQAKAELAGLQQTLLSLCGDNELKLILDDEMLASRVVEKRQELTKKISKQNDLIEKMQVNLDDVQKLTAGTEQKMYAKFSLKPALKRLAEFTRDGIGELAESVSRNNLSRTRSNLAKRIEQAESLFQSLPSNENVLAESQHNRYEANKKFIEREQIKLRHYVERAKERLELLDEATEAVKNAKVQTEAMRIDAVHTRAGSVSLSNAADLRDAGIFSDVSSIDSALEDVRFISSEENAQLDIRPVNMVSVQNDFAASVAAVMPASTFDQISEKTASRIFSNKGNATVLPYTRANDGSLSFITNKTTAYPDRKATVETMVGEAVATMQKCYVAGTKAEAAKACIWYLAHRKANNGQGPEVFVQNKQGKWKPLTMASMSLKMAEIDDKARKLKKMHKEETRPETSLHISALAPSH